ncbi:MAG: cysteine--tRNA ligase [Granulosicoccus sp.]|nr:cysteine--tRNA ligase [Granulosicoccus sp.]
MLQIYNTLNRRKELFKPLKQGHVGLYVCGITVYDECHVGHGRVMIVYDLLYRHLLSAGYSVNYVRNITDVDDKIINRAAELGVSPTALSQRYIDEMHADERALGVLPPTHEPRATESIQSMIRIIERLIESGHAYAADNGDVFYAVKSFAEYGKLSGRRIEELRAGERVAIDEHKRDPLDFVLWKSSKPGEPSWPSPWGDGRPGWHIECSAMSMDLLGEEFDIHGGGADLQFPHHENEIAQSEALTGGRFARYWMHNGMVRIDEEKMSKSLNNFLTLRDVLAEYSGEEIRTFILSSHYRSPLNYTTEALLAARTALRRFYTALRGRPVPREGMTHDTNPGKTVAMDTGYVERFDAAMNDDLNTPEAMAVLHELTNALNKDADAGSEHAVRLASTLVYLGGRLGLLDKDPEELLHGDAGSDGPTADRIAAMIEERQAARAAKDFARSDQIRDELALQGVILEDAGGKTTWRRV